MLAGDRAWRAPSWAGEQVTRAAVLLNEQVRCSCILAQRRVPGDAKLLLEVVDRVQLLGYGGVAYLVTPRIVAFSVLEARFGVWD